MHARKNLHGHFARIITHKLFVDFQNAFQLAIENLAIDVGQVEVDHRLAVDSQMVLIDNFVDCAGRHIARHQVAVFRIPVLEKIPTIAFRYVTGIAFIARRSRHPHAAAFAASRFRH